MSTDLEEFTEELMQEYFSALYNLQNGNNAPMKLFKEKHRELYSRVNANYHKRKIIRENVYAMKMVSKNIVFGALTYNEENNKKDLNTKRKQGVRHLNKYLACFIFVEELGSLHERYHLHFIGILKNDVSYLDFCNAWHSRAQIEKVISIKRSVNYLTDYVVKDAPRIRRNDAMIELHNRYKKSLSWSRYGFKGFAEEEKQNALINLVFDL